MNHSVHYPFLVEILKDYVLIPYHYPYGRIIGFPPGYGKVGREDFHKIVYA
jgi:hypothetical protein